MVEIGGVDGLTTLLNVGYLTNFVSFNFGCGLTLFVASTAVPNAEVAGGAMSRESDWAACERDADHNKDDPKEAGSAYGGSGSSQ